MKQRKTYIDYLRIVATLSVLISHVAAEFWYGLDIMSVDWHVINVLESALRWCLAAFVMISGSIFLSRDIPIKALYTKYIPRMVISYVFWSLLYAVVGLSSHYGLTGMPIGKLIKQTVDGWFHMWYIPMIIGLYMCIPIFKQIIQSKKVTKYFLCLSFVFSFLISQTALISRDFLSGSLADGIKQVYGIITQNMAINTVTGFAFYFILGYYINTIEFNQKQRSLIYVLGILGFIATVALTAAASVKSGKESTDYYDHFCINILMMAIAAHTWFRYRTYNHEKVNGVIRTFANCSFGVYMNHILLMNFLLFKLQFRTLFDSPLLNIPVICVILIIASFSLSWVIRKIPVLKNWIV